MRKVASGLIVGTLVAGLVGAPTSALARRGFPRHLDKKSWEVPEDMSWKDYKKVPHVPYYDKDFEPTLRTLRAALILGDFPDQKFRVQQSTRDVTGQKGLGVDNPGRYWLRYLFRNENPNSVTRGHTVDEYWLENTYGLIGVDAEAFGPYRMDGKYYEYGIGDFGSEEDCPDGPDGCQSSADPVGLVGPFDAELFEKSTVDVEAAQIENGEDYDFRFLLHAGYDESGTWLNFGQALFQKRTDVTDPWGAPGHPNHRNWATTRYVPWTSFWAAQHIWSHALPGLSSTQGESDGGSTYAHELSHIFGILDNYNNPYAENPDRSYSGPWDMMSRGTFNGPGGPFERWTIPPKEGGTMGSHHMIRNKVRLGFVPPSELLTITQADLAARPGGLIRGRILQRESPPAIDKPTLYSGLRVVLADDQSSCDNSKPKCDGGGYNNYDMEVVSRQGFDSFLPDHGVLIAKTKNADTSPFIWVIDAHPKNLNKVDYVRADGKKFRYTVGDYRQLSDAAFHVGTAPKTRNRYKDKANGLKFFILKKKNSKGRLIYTVAVKSMDSPSPTEPPKIERKKGRLRRGKVKKFTFEITNPGVTDVIYKLNIKKHGRIKTRLLNDLRYVGAGGTKKVSVWAKQLGKGAGFEIRAIPQ